MSAVAVQRRVFDVALFTAGVPAPAAARALAVGDRVLWRDIVLQFEAREMFDEDVRALARHARP